LHSQNKTLRNELRPIRYLTLSAVDADDRHP